MESHTQGGAFAYPGLNYSALSGLNTLILKHFRTLQSCMRPVSYLSAYGTFAPEPSLRSGSRLHIEPMLDASSSRPIFCEGAPSLRSGSRLHIEPMLDASSSRPIFCEGAPSLRSGSRLHIEPMLDAGPSLRSGPGLTLLTWLNASSPGTIFCERPVRARSFVRAHPHFVRVRAYILNRCSTLDPHFAQVRA